MHGVHSVELYRDAPPGISGESRDIVWKYLSGGYPKIEAELVRAEGQIKTLENFWEGYGSRVSSFL